MTFQRVFAKVIAAALVSFNEQVIVEEAPLHCAPVGEDFSFELMGPIFVWACNRYKPRFLPCELLGG